MKTLTAAIALSVGLAPVAHAGCMENLNIRILKADANWEPTVAVDPRTTVLHYGDVFRLHVTGHLPGVFHLLTIDPLDIKHTDFPALYTDGSNAVVLPCGTEADVGLCDTPGAPLELIDDFGDERGNRVEEERLVVTYTPCLSGNPALDARLGDGAAGKVAQCDDLLRDRTLLAQSYESFSYERAVIASKPGASCVTTEIVEVVQIRAAREN